MPNSRTPANDEGQTMAEYAILLALVFSVVVVLIPTFGSTIVGLFQAFQSAFGGGS
jgi:Flp pilus assembly pilin Flp